MTGIATRLQIWLSLVITLGLAVLGVLRYQQEQRRLASDLEGHGQAALAQLAVSLPNALDDLDFDSMQTAVMAEMLTVDVGGLRVLFEDKVIAGSDRDADWQPVIDRDKDDIAVTHRSDFATDDGSAGEIWLELDDRFMRQRLRMQIGFIVGEILLVIALVMSVIWFVVGRLTRPIRELTQVSERMAAGRLDEPIPTKGEDEIAQLARSFAVMRDSIRHQIRVIEEQNRDLDQRVQERTRELQAAQAELVQAAQQAGRAEMATGVLHNIGNMLTNICVGCEQLHRSLSAATPDQVRSIAALLDQPADELGSFIVSPRGQQVVAYFRALGDNLIEQRAGRLDRLKQIDEGVTMIREAVRMQQDYATAIQFDQAIDLQAEINAMILLQEQSFAHHDIQLTTDLTPVPRVLGQQTKIAHILTNLLTNAKDAMLGNPPEARRLFVGLYQEADQSVLVQVTDNGEGIDPRRLDSIFNFGYTTKAHGHGFGLHHSANAMTEMGGRLTVASEGIGCGCTFSMRWRVDRTTASTGLRTCLTPRPPLVSTDP